MQIGFNDILKLVAVCQFLFLAVVLQFLSKERSVRNLCLGAFLLSKALYLIDSILISYYSVLPDFALQFINIGSSFQFGIGPALYISMIASTRKDFALRKIHLLHLLPLLLSLGVMAIAYTGHGIEVKKELMADGFPYSIPWYPTVSKLMYLHFLIYAAASLGVLARCRREAQTYISQPVGRNLAFLAFIICDFMIFWGLNIINWYWGTPLINPPMLWTATVLNLFVVANTIVYQGMKFPDVAFDERISRKKYEKNQLTEQEKRLYTDKLIGYMNEKKPYLNPSLSLSDLATQLSVPPYILSQVLNVSLSQNFYDFVNNYRVKECKNLLMTAAGDEKTILEILYRSGFNSKSAFNAAFKKHAGMTPREFKKTVRPEPVPYSGAAS